MEADSADHPAAHGPNARPVTTNRKAFLDYLAILESISDLGQSSAPDLKSPLAQ
jgi:hypothetical protein